MIVSAAAPAVIGSFGAFAGNHRAVLNDDRLADITRTKLTGGRDPNRDVTPAILVRRESSERADRRQYPFHHFVNSADAKSFGLKNTRNGTQQCIVAGEKLPPNLGQYPKPADVGTDIAQPRAVNGADQHEVRYGGTA